MAFTRMAPHFWAIGASALLILRAGASPCRTKTARFGSRITARSLITPTLRPELEKAGHRYTTRCDTETIVHAYEEYGPDCVRRFRGMFAFAIWNAERRTLFCARDRLGIKPLYYFSNSRVFAFASEIKALLRTPGDRARTRRKASARVSCLWLLERR